MCLDLQWSPLSSAWCRSLRNMGNRKLLGKLLSLKSNGWGLWHTGCAWIRFMCARNNGRMAHGCKMIQLGFLSMILCVRMTVVDKQDKLITKTQPLYFVTGFSFSFVDM